METSVQSRGSRWVLWTSLPVLGTLALILLMLMLPLFFFLSPFLIFSKPGAFQYEANPPAYYLYNPPARLDADALPYVWPVPYITNITSPFGLRGSEFHKGIDIADARGPANTEMQPIYAMAAGTVMHAGSGSGYGQFIQIDHENDLITIYGHLEAMMSVREGDRVEKGQLIGRIGRGRVGTSTGPHLHFQVYLDGTAVDPLLYVEVPKVTLSESLAYRTFNFNAVKAWLDKRNSALADPTTLAAIDRAGKEENVDPHLLIAITGQEQSFVPKNGNHAADIIRNPWNVFGCWCSGKGAQLTTEESARIAAKTIVKLSQSRPPGIDPISWLNDPMNPNGIYAEHRGWWLGVSKFYKAILEEATM